MPPGGHLTCSRALCFVILGVLVATFPFTHAHWLPLSTELLDRSRLKRFHDEGLVFHLVHQAFIGMVAGNTGALCMIIAHKARAMDDDVVHIQMADLVVYAKIQKGVYLAAGQSYFHLDTVLFVLFRQVEHLLVGVVVNATGKRISEQLNKEGNKFLSFTVVSSIQGLPRACLAISS